MVLSRPARSPARFAPLIAAGAALLAALLLPGTTPAQTYPDPTGGTGGTGGTGTGANGLTKADFQIHYQSKVDGDWRDISPPDVELFFNRARCLCDQPFRVQLNLLTTGITKARAIRRAEIRLLAGDQTCVCTGAGCGDKHCDQIDSSRDINSLLTGGVTFDTTVRAIFRGGKIRSADDLSACNRDEMQNLWFWMDVADDATADTVTTDINFPLRLDGVPPAVPAGLIATPGNEALQLEWAPLPYLDDLQGYIVFCARNGDIPVFPGMHKPNYTAPASLCSGNAVAALAATPTPAPPAPTDDVLADGPVLSRGPAPTQIRAHDPLFACSDIITGAAQTRLYQLQNGIPYVVGVASVDKRGNASPIEEVVMQSPIPTRDFYRSYRDAGGSAEGGFCAIAPRRAPAHGLTLLVLAPLAALLVRRRRR